jgi:hypothetical protein
MPHKISAQPQKESNNKNAMENIIPLQCSVKNFYSLFILDIFSIVFYIKFHESKTNDRFSIELDILKLEWK